MYPLKLLYTESQGSTEGPDIIWFDSFVSVRHLRIVPSRLLDVPPFGLKF